MHFSLGSSYIYVNKGNIFRNMFKINFDLPAKERERDRNAIKAIFFFLFSKSLQI